MKLNSDKETIALMQHFDEMAKEALKSGLPLRTAVVCALIEAYNQGMEAAMNIYKENL